LGGRSGKLGDANNARALSGEASGKLDASTFLVTGANGQVGRALRARFPEAWAVSHSELDIADWDAVAAFDWSNIEVILNAAAYTNVDGAETGEGRVAAWQTNAVAAANLAKIAAVRGITLVHISSDYVFDGTSQSHLEIEPLSPLGVYGQSKAAGDIAASTAPKHYVLRASWVIGDGNNFVRTMIGLAGKNISPSVVADQVGRLTFTGTLAAAIEHLLKANAPFGTYNISNGGEPASWADITREIFADLGRDDLHVTDTTTAAYFASKPTAALRPLSSTFDLSKITAAGFTPPDWRAELKSYIANEKEQHA